MRRPLVLNGFMATGKTSVGRLVAARSARRFIDLDDLIEARAGLSVAQIFATRGEAEFRAIERSVLSEVLLSEVEVAPVVAVGGGALIDRAARLAALDRGVVVTLLASPAEIARRTQTDSTRPLLDGGNRAARAEELLTLRAAGYAEAHACLPTEGRAVDAIADDALAIWRRDPIGVAAGHGSYAVEIGCGIVAERLPNLIDTAPRVVFVTDENVGALHGERVARAIGSPMRVVLPPGEENKNIATVERIWRAALEASADRKALFVALGGGVVTDITGFAAASYMRGVGWIALPTSLLAMVDASVGGKTGVDLLAAKNAVGAFWQPRSVICDVDFLATETERAYRSALAEVVKTAIIGDPTLFDLIEHERTAIEAREPELLVELVRRSIRVKASIVSQDERESGLRAVLNLGHTVGHALEAVAGYSRLTHGEAVSLGLVAALRIGVALGVTPLELARRTEALLAELRLPTDIAHEPLEAAVKLIGHDKKRAGSKLKFVVARALGQTETTELSLAELERATLALGDAP